MHNCTIYFIFYMYNLHYKILLQYIENICNRTQHLKFNFYFMWKIGFNLRYSRPRENWFVTVPTLVAVLSKWFTI